MKLSPAQEHLARGRSFCGRQPGGVSGSPDYLLSVISRQPADGTYTQVMLVRDSLRQYADREAYRKAKSLKRFVTS